MMTKSKIKSTKSEYHYMMENNNRIRSQLLLDERLRIILHIRRSIELYPVVCSFPFKL